MKTVEITVKMNDEETVTVKTKKLKEIIEIIKTVEKFNWEMTIKKTKEDGLEKFLSVVNDQA